MNKGIMDRCHQMTCALDLSSVRDIAVDAIAELGFRYFAYVSNTLPATSGGSRVVLLDNYPDDFRDMRYKRFFDCPDDPVRDHIRQGLRR